MLIKNFNNKKVSDYLNTGNYKNVLIIFHHGLGDSIMFYGTCFKSLCLKYPEINFYYSTHLGQQDIFGYVDEDINKYDIAFQLTFPCSEFDAIDETKNEKCARVELGIKLQKEEIYIPQTYKSPLIAVHFNSTCNPNTNFPQNFINKLYEQIYEHNLIPIDTHMRHKYDNRNSIIRNIQKSRRIDDVNANIDILIGLIKQCRGFAGVISGNFWVALSQMDSKKILCLTSRFPAKRCTRVPLFQMNFIKNGYDKKLVDQWLEYILNN